MTGLEAAARRFISETHIKSLLEGAWLPTFDDSGKQLQGIRGRIGVAQTTKDGIEMGVDLFEMEPGSAFPLHTHEGDHILYGIKGQVYVSVDGIDHILKEGDSMFIPAEYPHGVKTIPDSKEVAQFLAFGHPHKHVSALDRLKLI
jgi:quercetin dioxygenase-like cupin family protein